MLDTTCTLPLPSDFFTLAIHPSQSLLAVGLSNGHVETFKLPSLENSTDSNASSQHVEPGYGTVDSLWKTRRHKGSCRALAYSFDGESLLSAGSNSLVKLSSASTGQVYSKLALPEYIPNSDAIDPPILVQSLTPQTLLIATDSGILHVYDVRSLPTNSGAFVKPAATHLPHGGEYVSSITPLPVSSTSTSGLPKQWLSTGGSTLAVTDLRRGVLSKSEDQEAELLSSCYLSGLGKTGSSQGEKAVVGNGDGIITLWEKGVWDDQDERVYVSKEGESLDVLATVPDELQDTLNSDGGKLVVAGCGDGRIRFVRIGGRSNGVIGEAMHDEVEGVVGLGFDVHGRMISGGGQTIKIWSEAAEVPSEDEENEQINGGASAKRQGSESDSDESDDESSEEEEKARKRRKRRKRNKAKDKSGSKPHFGFTGID